MPALLVKLGLATIVGVVTYLACVFVGGLLVSIGAPPAEFVGSFLRQWAIAIAVLVAGWYFLTGGSWTWPSKPPA